MREFPPVKKSQHAQKITAYQIVVQSLIEDILKPSRQPTPKSEWRMSGKLQNVTMGSTYLGIPSSNLHVFCERGDAL